MDTYSKYISNCNYVDTGMNGILTGCLHFVFCSYSPKASFLVTNFLILVDLSDCQLWL